MLEHPEKAMGKAIAAAPVPMIFKASRLVSWEIFDGLIQKL